MHCDVKKFQYSGKKDSSICSVNINASVYGTTMTFDFLINKDKKEAIVESLLKAKIPLKSVGLSSISINTPLHNTTNIKKCLEILSNDGFMSEDFAKEIATNYPNGSGGTMDLNNLSKKSSNIFLLLAAKNIFNLNKLLEKESEKNNIEDEDLDSFELTYSPIKDKFF